MSWVATAVAVASALATAYETHAVAKKQDQNAAAGIRNQESVQNDANKRILSTISDAKKSTSADERNKAQQQYLQTVQAKLGAANQGLATRGISQQFDQLASGEAANNADYGATLSNLMARMDAPINQRKDEAASYGNLGMDLTRLGQTSSGQDFLTRLRAASIRRNPYIDAAAAAGNGFASNYRGGGGGTSSVNSSADLGGSTYGMSNTYGGTSRMG